MTTLTSGAFPSLTTYPSHTLYPSSGAGFTPDLVLGWDSSRQSRTVVHDVLGRPDPDVTLRPASTRTGTLRLFFLDLATAVACEEAHAAATIWTLSTADVLPATMRYVVDGQIRLTSDGPAHARWVLEAPFREIAS